MRRPTLTPFAAALALALPALAQTAPANIRGRVAALSGEHLTVRARDGRAVDVTLAPAWSVVVMRPVDVAAIQPGSFIGTTTIERPDGVGRSLEVHVFPPGVKVGQGHYPWDLEPGSMMTNGDVGRVVSGPRGRTLEVAYPGGTHTILVPPDGALRTDRVLIGQDGAFPPM